MLNRLFAYNPNLKQSWVLIVILTICGLIFGVATAAINDFVIASKWVDLIGHVVSFFIAALIVVRLGKNSNYEPVASLRQSPLLWLLLVPFTLSFGITVEPLSAWIPMPEWIKQIFAELMQKSLPTFLMVVVFAPICEEWLLRGIILKGLLTHYSPRKAIVWSAVMFAVMHLNPWQGILAFFLGLMIGWVYWRTRSLWCCIFIHAVNNAASYILSVFIFPDVPVDASIADIAGGYYIYAVALAVCVLTGIWVKRIISPSPVSAGEWRILRSQNVT